MSVIRPKVFSGPKPKQYLRSNEAASYIGLAISTLAKLRVDGTGPRYIRAGRILYDRDDLDAWLASRKRLSTSENGGA